MQIKSKITKVKKETIIERIKSSSYKFDVFNSYIFEDSLN